MRRRRKKNASVELDWLRTARWLPVGPESGRSCRDSNLSMCAQDVGSHIDAMSYGLRRRSFGRESERLKLESCSDELRQILIDSLPYNDHAADLDSAVIQFVQLVAQEMVWSDGFTFEVCGGWNRSMDTPRLQAAQLLDVRPSSLVRIGPWYCQVIPEDDLGQGLPAQVVRLDGDRLVTFLPPPKYRAVLRRLRRGFSDLEASEHRWMTEFSQGRSREDFKAVHESYNVQRARLTAPIGWNARWLYQDQMADFHRTIRELRWRRFCIEMRDAMLETLSRAFAMIGAWRGETPRLVWDALPNTHDVDVYEARLMGKGAPFNELLRTFWEDPPAESESPE